MLHGEYPNGSQPGSKELRLSQEWMVRLPPGSLPFSGTAWARLRGPEPSETGSGPPSRLTPSRALGEQMAARAARALWEVIGSIFVATEADGALRSRRIFVTAVAQIARLVLGLGVQARKLLYLVTSGAGRNAGRPRRAVGTVAGQATGAELSMSALLLGAMAVGARFPDR